MSEMPPPSADDGTADDSTDDVTDADDIDDDIDDGTDDGADDSAVVTVSKRRTARRTWPQRLTIVAVVASAFACLVAAGTLTAGQMFVSQRNLGTNEEATSEAFAAADPEVVLPGQTAVEATSGDGADGGVSSTTIPLVLDDPDTANFLIIGADNADCAGDVISGDRSDIGERSDTIMVWRANPNTKQLAVLSFPRDLWVQFPNSGKRKINSAFRRDDPSLLREVLKLNFGVEVDHWIQIDFCAFRRLVDAVGGVGIPFTYPARDQKGKGPPHFLIPQTGCVTLDGDTALAYVRARYYQYEDPPGSGNWKSDPTSDFGRIGRQQDFLRRVLAKIIDQGLYDPDVASALITTNREYLVTDRDLTLRKMLEFANALKSFDPARIRTYRIDSRSITTSGGESAEEPLIRNSNMKAILAVFRGEATLADAPDQVLATTTTFAPGAPLDASDATSGDAAPTGGGHTGVAVTTSTTAVPATTSAPDDPTATTLPVVDAEENVTGIVPDRSVVCP